MLLFFKAATSEALQSKEDAGSNTYLASAWPVTEGFRVQGGPA